MTDDNVPTKTTHTDIGSLRFRFISSDQVAFEAPDGLSWHRNRYSFRGELMRATDSGGWRPAEPLHASKYHARYEWERPASEAALRRFHGTLMDALQAVLEHHPRILYEARDAALARGIARVRARRLELQEELKELDQSEELFRAARAAAQPPTAAQSSAAARPSGPAGSPSPSEGR